MYNDDDFFCADITLLEGKQRPWFECTVQINDNAPQLMNGFATGRSAAGTLRLVRDIREQAREDGKDTIVKLTVEKFARNRGRNIRMWYKEL